MKKSLLLAALLALPFAVVTAADAPAKPKRDQSVIFKAIDQNADGSLSFEEYKASTAGHVDPSRVSDLFKKKDADGDGKLTLSEFTFVPPQEAPKPAFAGENKKAKKEKSADTEKK